MSGLLLIGSVCSAKKPKVIEKCDISLKKCTVRMTCGLALHDYRISCKEELYGRTNDTCSELCQLATISLANTAEGKEYLNCDCADNTYCNLLRNRTKACHPEMEQEMAKTGSCRISELYCKADPRCVESWNYYRYLCETAFIGKSCSSRCNTSLAILSRDGVNVRQCECEPNVSYDRCRTEQKNVLKLCSGVSSSPVSFGGLAQLCLNVINVMVCSLWSLWPTLWSPLQR